MMNFLQDFDRFRKSHFLEKVFPALARMLMLVPVLFFIAIVFSKDIV
jgi:hypothetical protein